MLGAEWAEELFASRKNVKKLFLKYHPDKLTGSDAKFIELRFILDELELTHPDWQTTVANVAQLAAWLPQKMANGCAQRPAFHRAFRSSWSDNFNFGNFMNMRAKVQPLFPKGVEDAFEKFMNVQAKVPKTFQEKQNVKSQAKAKISQCPPTPKCKKKRKCSKQKVKQCKSRKRIHERTTVVIE